MSLWDLYKEIRAHVSCLIYISDYKTVWYLVFRLYPNSLGVNDSVWGGKHDNLTRPPASPSCIAHAAVLSVSILNAHRPSALLPLPPSHCMLIFISALAAGAEEQPPRLNAGLISQVKTLLIDIEYNYITRYAYPPTSY